MVRKHVLSRVASAIPSHSARRLILKGAGFKIGKNVKIGKGVKILASDLWIGDNSRLADNVFIGRLKSIRIGEFTEIAPNVVIDGDDRCSIGDNCFIGTGYHLNVRKSLKIGNNVALGGANGQVWTHSTWSEEFDGYRLNKIAPVTIKDNAWIGTRSIILPGVTIGRNSIIGANSLVTKSIPERVLAFGSPAKPVKKEAEYRKKLSDKDKKNIMDSVVEGFVKTRKDCKLTKSEGRWWLKLGDETMLISLNPILPETREKLDNKTSYFDLSRKRCSNKGLKLEAAFRKFANHYFARFSPE